MNHTDASPSAPDRRPSTRLSMASSTMTDDEDYDLHAMAVSDGFRPGDSSSATPGTSSPPSESAATPPTSDFIRPAPPQVSDPTHGISQKSASDLSRRPSSISKVHRPHDSLTLRNDGLNAGAAANFPSSSEHAGAGSHIIRMESPFQGPSGPSHPYAMYPQRTLSNATVSTDAASLEPSQPFPGQGGPTHPYALYTQHTTPIHEGSQQHIPLGFTGMAGGYQRQLGPDDEDAGGLIGPLGHTEELPPYTRYPTEAYARTDMPSATVTPAVATPNASTSTANLSTNPAVATTIPGAGGIGMATRNPEFSSDEDLPRPSSHQSIRSPSQASQHEINTAAHEIAEKPTVNKWQRRARKKVCGIVPYWAICLVLTLFVVMTSVMAGVLTTVLGHDRSNDDDFFAQIPSPVQPDLLPYLPADVAPLAVGTFGLPTMDPSQASRSCFNDSTQAQAWSCNIPGRVFSMNVSRIPNASETENYQLTLAPFDPPNSKYIRGTAPPNVPNPVTLRLVNDTFEPGRSPAWWLKVSYNKTVIVFENDFKSMYPTKRDWTYTDFPENGFDSTQFKKQSTSAVDGDKPWICTWPETTLEIFIFPSQNSSLAMTTTTSAAYPGPTAVDQDSDSGPGPFSFKPYPRMIKFLERRQSFDFDPPPYCRQVEIYSNGHLDRPVLKNGRPVVVEIVENDRLRQLEKLSKLNTRGSDLGAMSVRDNGLELTDCGCLWWMT